MCEWFYLFSYTRQLHLLICVNHSLCTRWKLQNTSVT